MLKSASTLALTASLAALALFAPAYGGVALMVAGAVAALMAAAVMTGLLGRRAGVYTGERAVVFLSVAVALVLTGNALIGDGVFA